MSYNNHIIAFDMSYQYDAQCKYHLLQTWVRSIVMYSNFTYKNYAADKTSWNGLGALGNCRALIINIQ